MKDEVRGRRYNGNDVLKGLAAGLIGGLVASWTMTQFQSLVTKIAEDDEKSRSKKSSGKKEGESEEGDDATVKAATAISENVFDHKLTKSEKKIAGPAVHYTFGTLSGGFYGAAAEVLPIVSAGAGLPFGTIFWLTADEAAVPALGLSKPPTETPLSTHAYAFASHLVYGLTADLVRRAVRQAL